MAGGSAAARIDLRISTPRVSRRRAEPTSARTEWKEGAHVQQSTHRGEVVCIRTRRDLRPGMKAIQFLASSSESYPTIAS